MSRIRITGGEWRSRLVKVSDKVKSLRPTPDRVRVTLFNWLGQDLSGLACLDLFAGSGVLGFEAASRGAALVTLVEEDRDAFAVLRQNAEALGGEQLQLVRSDALKFVASTAQRYDLIFLDPPYRQGWIERIEPCLSRLALPGARIYIEAERVIETLGEWRSSKRNQAGQVFYHLMEQA
ncbi:MAG: 16S rRNA (guanine(966)-N(2))-methyltransferase RsmD [Betaproteobacteria bacterium]|nr:16S rRNA (guanine(966)-N(2))-methyltransferase RsmD [Betaproteobacteria bacterium]